MPVPDLAAQAQSVSAIEAALAKLARVRDAAKAQLEELSALEPALFRAAFSGAL